MEAPVIKPPNDDLKLNCDEDPLSEKEFDSLLKIARKRRLQVIAEDDLSNIDKSTQSCKCKLSKCSKNYCNCLKQGKCCNPNCSCIDCLNNQKPTIIPQIIKEKRTCNCTKTGCLKKYCQCHKAKELCSDKCKCKQCKNVLHEERKRKGGAKVFVTIVPDSSFKCKSKEPIKKKIVMKNYNILSDISI